MRNVPTTTYLEQTASRSVNAFMGTATVESMVTGHARVSRATWELSVINPYLLVEHYSVLPTPDAQRTRKLESWRANACLVTMTRGTQSVNLLIRVSTMPVV